MAATSAWPMAFFPPHLAGLPLGILPHSSTSSKPRVGLGVICRCVPHSYNVECLLLKRGPKFVSPLKWSFPGGRLDEDGEGDDDGERCTLRELKKECGGGNPGGLPPLIHIESYKAGKVLTYTLVCIVYFQLVYCTFFCGLSTYQFLGLCSGLIFLKIPFLSFPHFSFLLVVCLNII